MSTEIAAEERQFVSRRTLVFRRFLRNRVRHEILPALAAVVPSASDAIARAAEITRVDAEYLDELAAGELARISTAASEALWAVDAAALAAMPTALGRRVARLLADRRALQQRLRRRGWCR